MKDWFIILCLIYTLVPVLTAQSDASLKFSPEMTAIDESFKAGGLSSISIVETSRLPVATFSGFFPARQVLANDFCYDQFAFFCKVEVRLEKAVNFPIKFRLGEVQYVERMEGKYGSTQIE